MHAFCFIHGTYQIIIQAKRLCNHCAIVSLVVLLRGLSCFHDFLHGASLCTSPCNAFVSQSCVLHQESVIQADCRKINYNIPASRCCGMCSSQHSNRAMVLPIELFRERAANVHIK